MLPLFQAESFYPTPRRPTVSSASALADADLHLTISISSQTTRHNPDGIDSISAHLSDSSNDERRAPAIRNGISIPYHVSIPCGPYSPEDMTNSNVEKFSRREFTFYHYSNVQAHSSEEFLQLISDQIALQGAPISSMQKNNVFVRFDSSQQFPYSGIVALEQCYLLDGRPVPTPSWFLENGIGSSGTGNNAFLISSEHLADHPDHLTRESYVAFVMELRPLQSSTPGQSLDSNLAVYPTTATPSIPPVFSVSAPVGQAVRLTLYDLVGRPVRHFELVGNGGEQRVWLDSPALPSGTYQAGLESDGRIVKTTRFIVEK